MKAWEIDQLRRGCKGKWLMRGETARAFNGRVCTDSRKAAAGDLFIAIKGERFDAHDFVSDVIEKEVAAILVHRELPADLLTRARDKGVAVIGVEDTIAGLNRLAAAYRANEVVPGFRAKVIAVGGSNGKTSTKRILHALLAEKFGNAGGTASPKSFNNNIGMPLTLLEVMPAHDYVVLEIGTNAPGEIAALGAVCRPDVALITSIGLEHLEKLADLAGVAREEAAIAGHLAPGGTLVLADVPELLREVALAPVQKVVVRMANDEGRMTNQGANDQTSNDKTMRLSLTGVEERMEGTAFSINGRGAFFVPLLGAHNAANALMAIAAARRLGVSDEQIAAGLLKVKPAEGRFERLQIGTWLVIHDAYNANPTSVEASLKTFAALTAGRGAGVTARRRVVVLGDMLELGAASSTLHQQVGRQVAAGGFEIFIAVGTAMRAAAEEAQKGSSIVHWFSNTADASTALLDLLRPGDDILLKGSHGMALERLLETLHSDAPARARTVGAS